MMVFWNSGDGLVLALSCTASVTLSKSPNQALVSSCVKMGIIIATAQSRIVLRRDCDHISSGSHHPYTLPRSSPHTKHIPAFNPSYWSLKGTFLHSQSLSITSLRKGGRLTCLYIREAFADHPKWDSSHLQSTLPIPLPCFTVFRGTHFFSIWHVCWFSCFLITRLSTLWKQGFLSPALYPWSLVQWLAQDIPLNTELIEERSD